MSARRVLSLASALSAAALATGCSSSSRPSVALAPTPASSSDAAVASVAPSPVSPAPTSAQSSSPAASKDAIARAEVLAFVPTYYATVDRLQANPGPNIGEINDVATQPNVSTHIRDINGFRGAGQHTIGTTKVVSMRVVAVNLTYRTNTNPTTFPTVRAVTCIDVTDAHVVDNKTGKVFAVASRPNFYTETLTMVDVGYPASNGWRVAMDKNAPVKSCAG